MGLYQENTNNYADIIRIVNGKLAKKVSPETPGATKRPYTVIATGEEKYAYELYYPAVEGHIISGQIQNLQFGQVMELTFENDGEKAIISIPFPGALSESLICRLLNVDLDKPVRINAGADKETGKNFTWLTQGGKKVEALYSKDNPGDCPPVIYKVVGGKTKRNGEDRTDFLYNKFVELFGEAPAKSTPAENSVDNDEDEDVPF